MKLIVDNVKTKAIVGGSDFLLDVDVMQELRHYLRVRPKGYNYSPLYKKRQWDGYRYFITPSGDFATGFLPMVSKFLEDLGVEIEVEDLRKNLPVLNDEITDYIGEIDGEIWTARDYQVDMIKAIKNTIQVAGTDMYFPRGILDCATNAGKNSMSALIINNVPNTYKVVFMVSNVTIYEQAVDFFQQVLGKEKLGQVCSKKVEPQRVTVCMVKTLLNRARQSINIKKWLKEVDVLIVDESDEAGATDYSKTLTFIGAGMRVFVSGTPLEAGVVNNMIAIGLSGKVLGKIKNKFLIDNGYSQKPIIKILLNKSGSLPFASYSYEMQKFIHESEHRASLIAGIVNEHSDKQILISFIQKEHGYFMYNYLKKYCHDDIAIVHGTSPDRREIIESYKKGKVSVLLSSMILKRGANIPNIEVLILAQGGKSTITVKQLVGRGLRHDGKSDEVLIYDFYDDGKHIGKHSRDRIKIYKNEEFDVELMYEQRRGKPI